MRTEIVNTLLEARITAIVRGIAPEKLRRTADALCEGGVRTIEVTFDTPGAADMIRLLKKEYADKMLVGAGTVLDTETCRTAILAGADFVLAPTLNTEVIKMCNRYRVPMLPGVMTPTEAIAAMEAGCDVIKIFPGNIVGPAAISSFKGPLPQGEFMPSGGVDVDNVDKWIKAGAYAVGTGSSLTKGAKTGDFAAVTAKAKEFVDAVAAARAK